VSVRTCVCVSSVRTISTVNDVLIARFSDADEICDIGVIDDIGDVFRSFGRDALHVLSSYVFVAFSDPGITTRSTSQGKGAKPKSPTYGFDWFGDVT
jgi:hypothetical protein